MKKVLILSTDYYPGDVGGAEAAIGEITDRISKDDIEFHMVVMRYDSNHKDVEQLGNILVHRIGFGRPNPTMEERRKFPLHYNKHLFQFTAAFKAVSLHRKYKYDAIWAMMAHGTGVPAAIFKLYNPKVPYILTLQEGDPPEHIEKVMRPLWILFKRAFTTADIIQSISSFLSNWAVKMGYKGDIELIHNGANPDSINPSYGEEEIVQLKKELGKKPDDIFLTNTARLVKQKGFDTTIKALPKLDKNIRLLIVGGGPEDEYLKTLVKELKLGDRVIFTGQVPRTEVSKYRSISDIFVGPSRSEGLGNAFLSAMALHLPVIATQEGGIAEFLFDKDRNPDKGTTGFAVDKESPEQIVAQVKYILTHRDEVKEITKRARKMVEEKYNWDAVALDMQEKVFSKAFNLNK